MAKGRGIMGVGAGVMLLTSVDQFGMEHYSNLAIRTPGGYCTSELSNAFEKH